MDDTSVRVTVPDFVFIGHDEIEFKSAVEQNGVLAWTTPEIDQSEVSNEILNGEAQAEYLVKYQDVLVQQTESYYRNLIHSVDPTITVEFQFDRD